MEERKTKTSNESYTDIDIDYVQSITKYNKNNNNSLQDTSDNLKSSGETKSQFDNIDYSLYDSGNKIIVDVFGGHDTEGNLVDIDTINVKVNEEDFNVYADEYGDLSYSYVVQKPGTYTVTLTTLNEDYYPYVINRTFEIDVFDAIIELYDFRNIEVGSTLTIGGRVYSRDEYDNEYSLAEIPLSLMIDGELVNEDVTTDFNGFFIYPYTPDTIGTKNITVLLDYELCNKVNASTTVDVTLPKTEIKIYNVPAVVAQNELVEITVYLCITLDPDGWQEHISLSNENIVLTLNGAEYHVTTNEYGYYSDYFGTELGINNITVSYDGKDVYQSISVNKTFIVSDKEITSIFLYHINEVQYGSEITLYGYVSDWRNHTVVININGDNYTTTTMDEYFNITYKTKTVGTNNITVSLVSDECVAEDCFESFEVTKLDMGVESSVKEGSDNNTLEITYKLFDAHGQVVPDVSVIINDETVVTTDSNGEVVYNYVKDSGNHQVSFFYEGDEYHYSVVYYLTLNNNKINTWLYVSYGRLSYNSTSGQYVQPIVVSLFDYDYNPLISQSIKVIIDGEEQTVTTDLYGHSEINYTTSVLGTKNIVISYAGNGVYSSSDSIEESFEVRKLNIDYLDYDLEASGNVISVDISGGSDELGNWIHIDNMNIKVNEEEFNVTAENYYQLSYNYFIKKPGNYTVTVTTLDELYYPINFTKSFEIKKFDAYIEVYDIYEVELGSKVSIRGKVYTIDENNNECNLAQMPIKLFINGEQINANIIADSYFSYSGYIAKILGINNVTVMIGIMKYVILQK